MRLHKTDISFYSFCFFREFAFVYPVYIIMFRDHGLDFIRISVLLTVWALTALVLEIPSGILADLWSRKLTVMLSLALKALGFLVWLFFPSFTGFMGGFILWGTMEAFCSGTTDALLFDALKKAGREDAFERVSGRGSTASSIGIALAMAAGGWIWSFSPQTVMVLSAAAMAAAALFVLPIPDDTGLYAAGNAEEKTSITHSVRELLRLSREMLSGAGMIQLLAFGSLIGGAYGEAEEFDTLFGLWAGVPVALVGLWGSVRFLTEGAGGFLAAYLRKIFSLGKAHNLAFWSAVSGVLLFLGTLHRFLLPFYFLYYLMIAVAQVSYQGTLQRKFESTGRATFSSVASFLFTGCAIPIGLLLGVAAEALGIEYLFRATAVIIIAAAVSFGAAQKLKPTAK